ncbi:hypothetical protein [Phenylobacterium sp. Root700]|uniref:hypothetical protein n=1 Tax=Phenylobacterium sp. Root700 TaxID=1736591 RepID=UPI0006F76CD2|nr:hypothetical protein [Phenylobacterium sp. Root700]KRB40003.1 hypothetical protein ASE02_09420 [Phenylobacterium sp. Root700]
MRLVLVPSPFVGANSWRELERVLPNSVVADYGGVSAPDWYAGAARRIADQVDVAPWVAVLHSSAGGFAPALASASTRLSGLIFVDAVLPHPGKSALDIAPQAQIEQLRALTTDGRLARWNEWFGSDPTPHWIADAKVRAAFLSDLPRVPFAFLEAVAPEGTGWELLPAAFIQLSKGFETNAGRAEARGWPVRRARLNHLAMASDPQAVAELLAGLP